ncbi:MAG TPA: LacI family DNA-binding transcriptional regulator [Arachnia sp.]|nr:LacI family DNA-binding transcriptional regulator [Arachnia sp.]HMT84747.1 LacI family DNA-binding transcriptional regulator [Arachnia sp.]
MKKRVTIDDIAAEVGVSRQTVTRAMNGMPRISETTRAKVLDASRRLGYQPSRFAKNLARNAKTKAIGFVVESFRNPYYTELTAELLNLAAERGWQVTVSSHEASPPLELPRRLAGEVDVIVGYVGGSPAELAAATHGVPVVLIGDPPPHPGIHSVAIDFDRGIADLLAGLRERGSQRFGLLESRLRGTPYRPSPRRQAYERYVDAASRDAVVVCEADYQSVDAGISGLRRLRAEFPETDTVIAFSDLMAMGALVAAHEDGLRVPEDVRIVGVDGLSLGAVTFPALSTLAILGSELAEALIGLIDRIFDGTAGPSEHLSITPRPLWRGSA